MTDVLTRTLAGSDLEVGRLVLGTMTFGTQVDEAAATQMVAAARDAGVTMFDTANNYGAGASEEILGRVVRPFRDEIVLCTKAGNAVVQDGRPLRGLSRDALHRALDGSLRRLGVDHVDVYYLHVPDRQTPFLETLAAADELVRAGKVRYLAQSNHAAWQVAEMVALAEHHGLARPSISQPLYNLLSRRVEAEYAECSAHLGLTDVVYNPLAGGLLTGKHSFDEVHEPGTRFTKATYQDRYWHADLFTAVDRLREVARHAGCSLIELALRWVLGRPLTDCVLLGASSPEQLTTNLAATQGGALDADTLQACDDVWDSIAGAAPPYHR